MGQPEAQRRFEEMYMAHYPAVLSYVRRRSDSPDDAADAIAETFTVAWRKLDDVPEGDEARPWLYGVARRVLANLHRGENRRTALAVRLRNELTTWAESIVDSAADTESVRAAFHRLSGDDREILSLVGWEGLDNAEIAKVLDINRGTVRLRLHRARKRLAKELESAGLDITRYGSRAASLVGGES